MAEDHTKQYRYTLMVCQRAKDGYWIADEVKIKTDVKEEIEGMLKFALDAAKKQLAELNKKE